MTGSTTSSTVDDILRRSAARTPGRTALVFGGRSWTYADLDAAVTRAAARLLGLGAVRGDRVAAYGRNSDAYLIGFLACARAGLVHVPVNFALQGEELAYLLEQSGSTIVLTDPALRPAVDALRDGTGVEQVLELREGPGSLLADSLEGPVPELDAGVRDTDLVQLLYTSGTTSRPKGAMMTHRALVHEYLSCVVGLDLSADDEPLHAMPLYHSAQMHVFLMPWLAVGARNTLAEAPDPADLLERIETAGHRAFFAAPTLWVAMAGHPDFARRDLTSLRKAYYGASQCLSQPRQDEGSGSPSHPTGNLPRRALNRAGQAGITLNSKRFLASGSSLTISSTSTSRISAVLACFQSAVLTYWSPPGE